MGSKASSGASVMSSTGSDPHSRELAAEGGPAVEFGLNAIILQLSQVWGLFPITQGSLTSVPPSTSDLQNYFLSLGQRQIDSRLDL